MDAGVVDELADFVRRFLVHLLGQDLVLGVGVVHVLADALLGDAQELRQAGGQGSFRYGPVR